jgi:hypothetical protein
MSGLSGTRGVPAPQLGLELFNVPGLALAAIALSDSSSDFLAEIVVRERGGCALLDEEVNAMRGWVLDVRKAVTGGDGS